MTRHALYALGLLGRRVGSDLLVVLLLLPLWAALVEQSRNAILRRVGVIGLRLVRALPLVIAVALVVAFVIAVAVVIVLRLALLLRLRIRLVRHR